MSTSAPVPGVGARQEAIATAQRVLVVRLRDQTFRIVAASIPVRIQSKFMVQTGHAIEWYLQPERAGAVGLCGLWLLSRLIDGEDVTWDQVLGEWDAAGFTNDDVTVVEETPEESDSPEA